MNELIFEVLRESDGGYVAECLGENIFTEGDTWEQLRSNVQEAVRGFYFDQPEKLPARLRLHCGTSRLAGQCGKLLATDEQVLADEGLSADAQEWPTF